MFQGFHGFGRWQEMINGLRINRQKAANPQRLLVHLHRDPIKLNGLLNRQEGKRHKPLLQRISDHHHISANGVTQKSGCYQARIERFNGVWASPFGQFRLKFWHSKAGIPIAHKLTCDGFFTVKYDARRGRSHQSLAIRTQRGHDIAGQHQITGLSRNTHSGQVGLAFGDPDMRRYGATALCHADHIECRTALTLKMGRHGQHSRNGDNAITTNARDEDVPGAVKFGFNHIRQWACEKGLQIRPLRFSQDTAFNRHEARAEALNAGNILIAGGLVDAPFGAEFSIKRHHGYAIRFHGAIAAPFAYLLVDHGANIRIHHRAALLPPPFFRRAGLIINERRGSFHLAQFTLHRVDIIAIMKGGTRRIGNAAMPRGILAHDRDPLDAFGPHLPSDPIR